MVALLMITIVPVFLYVILILHYTFQWHNYPEYHPDHKRNTACFTVVIPFRNEQQRLPCILHDLISQDYPVSKTEIMLVNDHSDDNSVLIGQDYCRRYNHVKLIQLSANTFGKKEAILAGVLNAANDIIVTLDADCRPGNRWLSTLASFYHDYAPAIVIGLVVPQTNQKGFFNYFQQIESLSLTGAGAASAIANKPIYCSGANLSYLKSVFIRFDDPLLRSVISGDDTFLLLQAKKYYRRDIRVLKSKQAFVETKVEAGPAAFINQRSRWISKSKYYHDPEIIYSALIVAMANAIMILSPLFLFSDNLKWLFPALITVKLLTDGWFIVTLAGYFGVKFRAMPFVLSALGYPVYLMIGMLRAFLLPVRWKGRENPGSGKK
jgi:poly-beta-1,6-N-acetyl-D-glucosamine synthase